MQALARSSVLVLAVVVSAPVQGQSICVEELLASDPDPVSHFGNSVALDGDRMLIGASAAPGVNNANTGAVYVFERTPSGWTETAKFFASDQTGQFGWSVDLVGDRALIGARFDGNNGHEAGAAYVFELVGGTWVQSAKLLASDGQAGDYFGWAVSLDDDTALIGAPNDDNLAGSAYFFERQAGGWVEVQKVVSSLSPSLSWFGRAVALEGDTAMIGAPLNSPTGYALLGAVFVFERTSTWMETATLIPNPAGLALFGWSLALDGETVLIGAEAAPPSGAAYVFCKSLMGWEQEAKLVASGPTAAFGWSVGLNGNAAIVGAPFDGQAGVDAGAAYVFRRGGTGWSEVVELFAVNPGVHAHFGEAVSIDGQFAVAGAPQQGFWPPGSGGGAAVAVDLDCPIGNAYCTPAIPNTTGVPGTITATGSIVVMDNDVTLTADQLPPNQFGYFLTSQTPSFPFMPPGSDGFICLGGNIGRYNGNVGQGPSFSLQIDLTNMPVNPPVAVQPGETWGFQCWYRDIVNTNNFTDGVSILFQ